MLLDLLGSDALRSRAFVTRRYDQLVQSRTVRRPGLDAAVLRLRPSYRGLAVTLDGTGRLGSLDPFTGGAAAILEAARNVACAGGEPLGFTDCLNFGNPEKPEIGWELAEAIEGMAQACEALGLPIVSGNVSLYNDTDGRSIHPTPVVGCVGLVPDVRRIPGSWRRGDAILLASTGTPALPGLGAAGPVRHRLRDRRPPSTSPPRRRSCASSSTPLLAARSRTTSPTAASPSRWPRLRSIPASAPGSTSRSTRSLSSARAAAR